VSVDAAEMRSDTLLSVSRSAASSIQPGSRASRSAAHWLPSAR
jgi:hypothetical protein